MSVKRIEKLMLLFCLLGILLILHEVYFWLSIDEWPSLQPNPVFGHNSFQEEGILLKEQIEGFKKANQMWRQRLENGYFNGWSQVDIIRCKHYLQVAESEIEEAEKALRKNSSTEAIDKLLEAAAIHLVVGEIARSSCNKSMQVKKIWRYLDVSYSALDSGAFFYGAGLPKGLTWGRI